VETITLFLSTLIGLGDGEYVVVVVVVVKIAQNFYPLLPHDQFQIQQHI